MPVSTGPEGNVRVYAKRDADTEPQGQALFVRPATPRPAALHARCPTLLFILHRKV